MEKGDLYQPKAADRDGVVVQIMKTWNKRDIDPYCPESVAIVPMVQYVVWQDGQKVGTHSYKRQTFRRRYVKVGEAQ